MESRCLSLKDLLGARTLLRKTSFDEADSLNEQKENICTDRRRTTPQKAEGVVGHWKASSPDTARVTPIKLPERARPDPWTPTANLKVLLSAASPEIRDREMKKMLFRPLENEEKRIEEEMDESSQNEASDEAEPRPSRKQKSLGLLCQKFLALYPDYPELSESISISLDEVATRLMVERRRIYDVVNVLESLLLLSRSAKNMYVWHGRARLPQTLRELHRAAQEQGYHLHINPREAHSACGGAQLLHAHGCSRRKDKSLRIMSQKFVMLFLVSRSLTVTLDAAARILIEEGQDESSDSKYKTKVRRLYDIANVLTSLSLIRKLQLREEKGRKPAFQWIGPAAADFLSSADPDGPRTASCSAVAERRKKMARHSSLQLSPSAPSGHRLISSAPSTPHRAATDEPVDYSQKSLNNNATCRMQFGDSDGLRLEGHPPCKTYARRVGARPPAQQIPPPAPAALALLQQMPLLMLYSSQLPEKLAWSSPPCKPPCKRARQHEDLATQRAKDREDLATQRAVELEDLATEIAVEWEEAESSSSRGEASPGSGSSCRDEEEDAGDGLLSSHYLYVPNSAGLNFLLPAAAHSQRGVPTVAMPCFLLPAPLIASSSSEEGPAGALGLHGVLSPARFVMAGGAYGVSEALSSPEPHGNRRVVSPEAGAQAQTPVTPKESLLASKAFFETPGAFQNLSQSPARKRGSAQRRLDIGHLAN